MSKYIISHYSFVYVSSSKYLLEIERLSRIIGINARNRNSIDITLNCDSYLKKKFTINKEY